jgi:hypothetical protein
LPMQNKNTKRLLYLCKQSEKRCRRSATSLGKMNLPL